MTERRIIKNLTEIINSMIKKTNAYEKTENVLRKISLVMMFTGTLFLINYFTINNMKYVTDKKLRLTKKIQNDIQELKSNISDLNTKLDIIINDKHNDKHIIKSDVENEPKNEDNKLNEKKDSHNYKMYVKELHETLNFSEYDLIDSDLSNSLSM
jgi:hypothetical protein